MLCEERVRLKYNTIAVISGNVVCNPGGRDGKVRSARTAVQLVSERTDGLYADADRDVHRAGSGPLGPATTAQPQLSAPVLDRALQRALCRGADLCHPDAHHAAPPLVYLPAHPGRAVGWHGAGLVPEGRAGVLQPDLAAPGVVPVLVMDFRYRRRFRVEHR